MRRILIIILVLTWVRAGYANEEISVDLPGGATMEFAWIEPGTFTMGSPESEPGRDDDEGPLHEVTISRGFWLGKYEVTQAQWEGVMESNPSKNLGANLPVEQISWHSVQSFIRRLNEAAGDSLYRLPSEAEWEYAARAGTTTRWSFGDDENQLDDYAWYGGNNSPWGTKAVGSKRMNPWGLYDMHGNVYEWVQDWYGGYSSASSVDPAGAAAGSYRVIRSGFFARLARFVRSALRDGGDPSDQYDNVGVRLLKMGSDPTAATPQSWGRIKANP